MDHFKSIVFGTVTVLCLRLLIKTHFEVSNDY